MIDKNKFIDLYSKSINKMIYDINKETELKVDYLIRKVIDKPIKGEITERKLKLRGITSIEYRDTRSIGIIQNGEIIYFVDVPKDYKLKKK